MSDAEAEIAFLKLTIEKLRREFFGQRSERKQRLLDQLELQLDELEASATEDELAAEKAAAETTQVQGFTRRKPARKPFPAHIPRERKVVPPPTSCGCCGSDKLSKIGEDVTETLEAVPRQLEGDPDGAREVHLPPLREDQRSRRRRSTRHPGAGRARTCWRRSCLREIRRSTSR